MPRNPPYWTNYENQSLNKLCIQPGLTGYQELSRRLKQEYGVRRSPHAIGVQLRRAACTETGSPQSNLFHFMRQIGILRNRLFAQETLLRQKLQQFGLPGFHLPPPHPSDINLLIEHDNLLCPEAGLFTQMPNFIEPETQYE